MHKRCCVECWDEGDIHGYNKGLEHGVKKYKKALAKKMKEKTDREKIFEDLLNIHTDKTERIEMSYIEYQKTLIKQIIFTREGMIKKLGLSEETKE